MDSQVAPNRTSKSHDQDTKFDLKDLSGMIIGEASTEQTKENAQNPYSGSNGGAECDPWKDWKDDGKTMERRWNFWRI